MAWLASYSEIIQDVSSLLIIFLQVVIVVVVINLIYEKATKKTSGAITKFFSEHSLWLSFLVVLGATLGSLYFSEIAKFPPCELCWFQRIFIYPQVILLGIAMFKKDYKIRIYSGAIAVIGVLFSIFHYIVEVFQIKGTCPPLGGPSCAERYFLGFGYVSLAMMALTVSLFVIIMMILAKQKESKLTD